MRSLSTEANHLGFNKPFSYLLASVPSPRGALVGLAPQNKAPIPPKLKRETL